MVNEVHPFRTPAPNAPIIWDGTDWRAIAGDTAGRVQVRGEDQLFSYKGQISHQYYDGAAAAGKNTFDTETVPAGEIWVVTSIYAEDTTSAITSIYVGLDVVAGLRHAKKALGPVAGGGIDFQGHLYAVEDDALWVEFNGVVAGDELFATFFGYKMTLET